MKQGNVAILVEGFGERYYQIVISGWKKDVSKQDLLDLRDLIDKELVENCHCKRVGREKRGYKFHSQEECTSEALGEEKCCPLYTEHLKDGVAYHNEYCPTNKGYQPSKEKEGDWLLKKCGFCGEEECGGHLINPNCSQLQEECNRLKCYARKVGLEKESPILAESISQLHIEGEEKEKCEHPGCEISVKHRHAPVYKVENKPVQKPSEWIQEKVKQLKDFEVLTLSDGERRRLQPIDQLAQRIVAIEAYLDESHNKSL